MILIGRGDPELRQIRHVRLIGTAISPRWTHPALAPREQAVARRSGLTTAPTHPARRPMRDRSPVPACSRTPLPGPGRVAPVASAAPGREPNTMAVIGPCVLDHACGRSVNLLNNI